MHPRQHANPQQVACTLPGASRAAQGVPPLGRIYISMELFMRAPRGTPPAHPWQQVQLK